MIVSGKGTADTGSIPQRLAGNNIQARVPELSYILTAPVVAGALETLLGPGALQYPHMYCHNLEPEGSRQQSRSFNLAQTGTCHQDAFSPLGRPRHHNPWHCYVCYYPQDTQEREATHIIPSSQFNNFVVSADNNRRIPVPVSGTSTAAMVCLDCNDSISSVAVLVAIAFK